jgi:predicted glycosyltransferase
MQPACRPRSERPGESDRGVTTRTAGVITEFGAGISRSSSPFDIVAGPYCTLPESFAPPSTLTVRIHQSVPDLWRWHQSADAVITSGGSNTVLETLRGRAKLLPVTTSRNGEIRILCERLHARGLSARPIAPESLTDFESHVTKCPKESFSLDMCTAERLDAELSAAMKKR